MILQCLLTTGRDDRQALEQQCSTNLEQLREFLRDSVGFHVPKRPLLSWCPQTEPRADASPAALNVKHINVLCGDFVERVKGIEPSYSAWEAAALPLSYTRIQALR
jgi:hypothetical protein